MTMGTRDGMVAQAEKSLGMRGRPNAITTAYANRNGSGFARAAWCNMAITEWARGSDNFQAVCFGVDYAYTVWHAQKFQSQGRWHRDVAGIQRGDIVFFDWGQTDNVGAIDHVGLVTDVKGGSVYTIEGNTSDSCARRVRTARDIAGYGRPAYAEQSAPPAPKPTTPGSGTTHTPPAFPEGLRPNSTSPSARGLQKALKAAGYMDKAVPEADNYGPKTQDGVAAFYRANVELSSGGRDVQIGPKGWAELHREAYGSGSKPPAPAPPPPPAPASGEPAHDYRRTTYGGRTVNQRTKAMLEAAAKIHGSGFRLSQGSYNRGVAASAGTHDGGGVVDIASSSQALVKALRQVGFAAWVRTPAEGFSYHIHACAIGDREMAAGARNQVRAYFQGRNGLANNRADSAPASVGRPYPTWAEKYR
ncbi:CHAP domain-containing protein [Streptomyces solincola]|uniref:CHAP domain-containing protein n=1 Tax=Streptomyces solincola TaxID=2100817 RepID=UPI0021592B1B|nr:CHAP domain-containing protein [Streptomyces solincola]